MSNTLYYDTTVTGGEWTTANYTIIGGNYGAATTVTIAPEKPKAESALEWLDRRVDEMRVQL